MKANLLKAEIARAGMTQGDLAKRIGLTSQTLSKKIITGRFKLEEAEQIIRVLGIKNPIEIFLSSD